MSDAPLTDRFMFGKPGIWSDWKDKDHLSLENHARRLEKALKVAEQELIAIHNAASIQGLPTFAAKVKETLSTIAKLKEEA